MVNRIVSLVSLSNFLLLVYIINADFYVLILYPATVPNSLVSFSRILVFSMYSFLSFPKWFSSKESTCQYRRHRFDPWVRKIPCRRAQQPTPVFLLGEPHGQRSLVGYSPLGRKELDTTERLHYTNGGFLSRDLIKLTVSHVFFCPRRYSIQFF